MVLSLSAPASTALAPPEVLARVGEVLLAALPEFDRFAVAGVAVDSAGKRLVDAEVGCRVGADVALSLDMGVPLLVDDEVCADVGACGGVGLGANVLLLWAIGICLLEVVLGWVLVALHSNEIALTQIIAKPSSNASVSPAPNENVVVRRPLVCIVSTKALLWKSFTKLLGRVG